MCGEKHSFYNPFDLKFGDGDEPNLYRVNKVDVSSSTFYWKYILVK